MNVSALLIGSTRDTYICKLYLRTNNVYCICIIINQGNTMLYIQLL